ncbi:MAG: protein-glutamate O-methyltransferase family protein, partial [Anaerolineae bacterium]|nr:protein-glutamate O-methyltransferase family protein [Anaerolineae bacterium]
RLPEIGRRILAENKFRSHIVAELADLIEGIPDTPIRPLTDLYAPDAADWREYCLPYLEQNWLQAPWFFVETYFYRRVLEATQYFEEGTATQGVDPFSYQKQQGLVTTASAIHHLCASVNRWLANPEAREAALTHLLHADLWGNQADLSLWPAEKGEQPNSADAHDEFLLVDDTTAVTHLLLSNPTRIDMIADNAGFELVADLCLIEYLLRSETAVTIHLHLKAHPTFVSDALIKDVDATIAFLAADEDETTRAVGESLRGMVENGRLHLHTHLFWTSPLPMWEMPADLKSELAASNLVISKGDANYRRLLGDRHWPLTTPFADVVTYFPAPLLALRTLKSEIVVNLAEGQADALTTQDPDWLINGKWGVIQFAP